MNEHIIEQQVMKERTNDEQQILNERIIEQQVMKERTNEQQILNKRIIEQQVMKARVSEQQHERLHAKTAPAHAKISLSRCRTLCTLA